MSFQDRFTEPLDGSTASHWLNWSLATRAGSSFTRSGGLQVAPPSVDRDKKMSVPLEAVWSMHEQYRVGSGVRCWCRPRTPGTPGRAWWP